MLIKNKVLVIIFLSIIFLSFYINQINGIELDENYYYTKIENVIKKINEIYYKGIKDDRLNIITNIINEAILNIEKGKMVKEKGNLEEAQKYFEKADNLINEAENEADKLLEEARIKDQNLKLTAYSTAVVAAIITYFSSILLFRFHNYWKRRKLENCIVIKNEENE